MAEGRRRKPTDDSWPPKIDPDDYELEGQLKRVVQAASRSPDAVALIVLGNSMDEAEGAIVILRGRETVELFEQWAIRNRVLDPTRPDGLIDALNGTGEWEESDP